MWRAHSEASEAARRQRTAPVLSSIAPPPSDLRTARSRAHPRRRICVPRLCRRICMRTARSTTVSSC
eukprot:362433-Pyramimonas_sp.AAC.1